MTWQTDLQASVAALQVDVTDIVTRYDLVVTAAAANLLSVNAQIALAASWAITAEDVFVPSGNGTTEYSSYHYMKKAEAAVATVGSAVSQASAAAASASAAGVQAGVATTQAGLALQHKNAANQSRIDAETAKVSAETLNASTVTLAANVTSDKNTVATDKQLVLSYKNDANTILTTVNQNSGIIAGHVTAAATGASTATTMATTATTMATTAQGWAITAEDTTVPSGNGTTDYSAYHWAQKAESAANSIAGPGTANNNTLRWSGTGWVDNSILQVNTGQTLVEVIGGLTVSAASIFNGSITANSTASFSAGLESPGFSTGSFRAGLNAATSNQGVNAIAIGRGAGSSAQGTLAVAVGNNAGFTSQGISSVAIGISAGKTNQLDSATAVGNQAGETDQGTNTVAVGVKAGETTQGAQSVALGYVAGQNTQGTNSVAVGASAATTNQGDNAVAVGVNAGQSNQVDYGIAMGYRAGRYDQGQNSTAVGREAGNSGQGPNSVALGRSAGVTNQGNNGIIINSTGAVLDDTSNGHIHLASDDGSLDFTTAAGWGMSGGVLSLTEGFESVGTGANSFRAGRNAGLTNQGASTVALGYSAGNGTQEDYAVAVGLAAGETAQGTNSVAVGRSSGTNAQGANAVAIGRQAGQTTQGAQGIAIGYNSGLSSQGASAVAVGYLSGQTVQGNNCVAVGFKAGNDTQGDNGVAIGNQAGETGQGSYSVAIGLRAGETAQGNNGIIINAGGTPALDDTTNGHIHINNGWASLDFTTAAGWSVNGGNFGITDGYLFNQGGGDHYQNQTTGLYSLGNNTTGINNTSSGFNALRQNTEGDNNTAVGQNALDDNIIGDRNTAIGQGALQLSTGSNNTVIGRLAGSSITTGSSNTVIGILPGTATMNNTLLIGTSNVERIKVNADGISINGGGLTVTGGDLMSYGANPAQTTNFAAGLLALGANTTGSANTAIGRWASKLNEGGSNNASVGYNASRDNVSSGNRTAVGVNSLLLSTGVNNVALGYGAGDAITTGANNTVIGDLAGSTTLEGTVLIGAGTTERLKVDSTGLSINGISFDGTDLLPLANTFTGSNTFTANTNLASTIVVGTHKSYRTDHTQTQLGTSAGGAINGGNVSTTSIGYGAGYDNPGTASTAIGNTAGRTDQGASAVSVGTSAGYASQGLSGVAVGSQAGQTSQGAYSVAVGLQAGMTTQGSYAVAVGIEAGETSQGSYSVAIGHEAGTSAQGNNGVAVGQHAGSTDQSINAVAVGHQAGQTTQGENATAVGYGAGRTTQELGATALGYRSGFITQGQQATAVGYLSGYNDQGNAAVAVGFGAGQVAQGTSTVAIGRIAGHTSQGNNSVAIGYQAAEDSQGNNSIAIGLRAGETSQGSNGIIINASGGVLNNTTAGHIHIASDDGSIDFTNAGGWTATDSVGTFDLRVAELGNSSVDSEHYVDNSIKAEHLDVSGNGTSSQYLRSDGDGSFTWATPTTDFISSGHYYLGNNDWGSVAYTSSTGGTITYSQDHQGMSFNGANVWSSIKVRVPIDPTAHYRIKVRVKQVTTTTGTGKFYAAVKTLNEDKTNLSSDTALTYNYGIASAQNLTEGTTYTFEDTFSGYNTSTDPGPGTNNKNKFDPEGKYFDLLIITNHQGSGETVIQSIEVERLPDAIWHGDAILVDASRNILNPGLVAGRDVAADGAKAVTAHGWGDHGQASYATESYVGTQISNLVDSSPEALDTLNELAAALGDDASFSATVATSIGTKLNSSAVSTYGLNLINDTNAAAARTTLGLGTAATTAASAYATSGQVLTNVPSDAVFTDTDTVYTLPDDVVADSYNVTNDNDSGYHFWGGAGSSDYSIKMGNNQDNHGTVTSYSIHHTMGTSSGRGFTFGSSRTAVTCSINALTGAILSSNNITAYSDARVKDNIEVIPNALDKVKQLSGYTYTRTDVEDKEKKYTGVIAQEVLGVLPEAVQLGATSEDTMAVAYGNMVGLLIEAIKEQQIQIDELKASH